MKNRQIKTAVLLLTCVMLNVAAPSLSAAELTVAAVTSAAGDGPDETGNTADDSWQFWFELAHKRGAFHVLDTHSKSVPAEGVPRKIRGPIAGMLPNPADTQGWIFHRDWDGRFEGIWGDAKADRVFAYPYVEKNVHLAVAVSYRIPADGKYNIRGKLTDLQVQPQFKQHDGINWSLDVVARDAPARPIGTGGPLGDGHGRPESEEFKFDNVELRKGHLIRLVIHPGKWWGSDMTAIDGFVIEPAQ